VKMEIMIFEKSNHIELKFIINMKSCHIWSYPILKVQFHKVSHVKKVVKRSYEEGMHVDLKLDT
jgi:hypothetical protein